MPNLPAFRRTRGTVVRLVPLQDLNDVKLMIAAVLGLQILILLGVLFHG